MYVVDFIGNGRSSRALVRKGGLRQLVRTTSSGQVFTILDDKNELVKNAMGYSGFVIIVTPSFTNLISTWRISKRIFYLSLKSIIHQKI